ncbi:hypothetical protein CRG98_047155 [Punica granatum]|uniref:Calcium-transporting ATPase n=1 Tax=Punica granatum TaxID=22663 RepID=A0A2I0HL71_PUNGR|nr:hypothetical protein CRG98_047155 [Punica granatum]
MTTILDLDCGQFTLSLSLPSPVSKYGTKWQQAFLQIYCSRAFQFQCKHPHSKAVPVKSPSFTAITIDNNSPNSTVSIDLAELNSLVKEKDVDRIHKLGGVEAVASSLEANLSAGISGDPEDFSRRQRAFGSNTYKKPPAKGLLYFVVEAFKDLTILILLGCAALSLGFGIKENGISDGWYDGGSIFVALFLIIAVSSHSNFTRSRQFEKLSRVGGNIQIEVIRNSRRQQVPADGLFLNGHSLHVDESSMTGEGDHVEVNQSSNPFLVSGTEVADGHARMIVTSVGMNTMWGEMMSSVNHDEIEQTPLQVRLNKLTSSIGKVGLAVAFLVLVVLLARYFTGTTKDENGNPEFVRGVSTAGDIVNAVVGIVSAAETILVVTLPEGLPLAVTLTLAYCMKRMMSDQAMVRKLSACETMGSATTICTDKTGTLTLNQMKVTKVLDSIRQGVALNTTGSVFRASSGSEFKFSGSPTEKAILSWAVLELNMDMEEEKKKRTILQVEAFNSQKKRSGVLLRSNADGPIHIHWKGAAEMVLAMCSSYYDASGVLRGLDGEGMEEIENVIQGMAAMSLRCIAFAHKETSQTRLEEDGLTLLGLVGIEDPCRPGVKGAVEACHQAGVTIKMITGDNVFTAKAIATECGILSLGEDESTGAVVEGVEFRNYTPEERLAKVEKIGVMARSSPFDKLLMVQCLKQKGHVVAVTGDGTNDAPALKEADIGLSMGIQGTGVAKESSDIVILDDNFGSVATVLRWGRCVYNNIQKFIQFQLTVNLWVNLIMDTLGALALATERPTWELMEKPPVGQTAPLITNIMWRNIAAQAAYQMAVFNEFNARKLEKKNGFADTERLTWGQWGACIGIGAVSWPIGFIVRFIPVPETPIFSYLKVVLPGLPGVLT